MRLSAPTPARSAVALVATVTALLTLSACGSDSGTAQPESPVTVTHGGTSTPRATDRPTPAAATTPSTYAPTDAPTDPPTDPPSDPLSSPDPSGDSSASTGPSPSEESELVSYVGGEAVPPLIQDTDDAEQLAGAPADFRTFIGTTAEKVVAGADCDGAAVGITVDAVRTDGYAVGAVNECGGYAAMWARVDGAWQEIQGTQDSWDCGVLRRYQVPSDLLLGNQSCFDYDGDQRQHAYYQA